MFRLQLSLSSLPLSLFRLQLSLFRLPLSPFSRICNSCNPAALKWLHLFRRWPLAKVSQARGLSQDHGNSIVPMLIGAQATGKSTFCKMLLPRHGTLVCLSHFLLNNVYFL
ncbi:MAG: hypothetical protein IJT98_10465 [Prevotella sp.]|nr:hypothetical protein [Prevotella sp.]